MGNINEIANEMQNIQCTAKKGIVMANMIEDEEIRLEAITAILWTILSCFDVTSKKMIKRKYTKRIKNANKIEDRDDRLSIMTGVIGALLIDIDKLEK